MSCEPRKKQHENKIHNICYSVQYLDEHMNVEKATNKLSKRHKNMNARVQLTTAK